MKNQLRPKYAKVKLSSAKDAFNILQDCSDKELDCKKAGDSILEVNFNDLHIFANVVNDYFQKMRIIQGYECSPYMKKGNATTKNPKRKSR